MACLVESNCKHRWECDFCSNYSDYQPVDKRILSPAQLDKKAKRKQSKKELKSSEASKRGKRNRSIGSRSEKYMLDKYEKWGIQAKKQPGSGKFKGSLGSDLKVTVPTLGIDVLHEDKTRSNAQGKFNKVKDKAILYQDFCIMMNELDFRSFICSGEIPVYDIKEDVGNKSLHDYFNQDDAQIVSIRLPGSRECVYAVKLNLIEEVSNVKRV